MARKLFENKDSCAMLHTINIIGTKWKPLILYLLANKSVRFGKLLFFMEGVSRKVLTDQLRELEEDGFILRQKFGEVPPRVEYSLTEKGKSFLPVLKQMYDWTIEWNPEISFMDCKIVLPVED
ncbi:DNA-binding HxlR family transcriptional regulator [Flavobacterium sp. 2755]|uniref:winged helix-turn-helix transcriptional regulator n=1 Tax=Flavobacterium sp. 2755 TaxID=2817765 RepID=UPI00285FEFEC|nr:helix-turn-helix domain-containing protein [Flavobacterium sp. 2755]MDR6762671.1 DNA-binding HxlR family transcriptional regulator [Flavobacterium sp. 2755]